MWNGFSCHGFDRPDDIPVCGVKERQRAPRSPRPACSSDPVDIVFGRLWQVIIDDMGDPVDVETPGRHVCCDQNLEVSSAEAAQNPVSDRLGLVSVESVRRIAGIVECDGQIFRTSFCPGKDDDLSGFGFPFIQDFLEKAKFLRTMGNGNPFLMDMVRTLSFRFDANDDRIVLKGGCKFLDPGRTGR